jgi:hypothetical protein
MCCVRVTRGRFLQLGAAAAVSLIGLDQIRNLSEAKRTTMNPSDAAYAVINSPTAVSDDPDVLSYKARAAAFLFMAGYAAQTADDLRAKADALWAARYDKPAGPSYGLGYAWDAFQDGSTDPANTTYTYTTMVAALAFLDVADALDDDTYRGYAEQLAETVVTSCWGYVNGAKMSPWYSDQAADKKGTSYVVHNVNALTLAVLARLNIEPDKAAGMKTMLASTIEPDGKWRYIYNGPTYNDLEHSSFMVEGVVTAGMPESQPALAHVWAFFNTNGTFDSGNSNVMGSTKWGPADGLSALSMSPEWSNQAGKIAGVLAASIGTDGVSSFALRTDPRSVIHYAVGLARYAATRPK